jgi:large subunit ribosomal protein L7e
MSAAAEAKAAAVPESVLRKLKREEQWAADYKEKALADRKKALESRKVIFARAKQYAQEYDAQVSSDPPPPALLLLGSLRLV